jgi:hypothetical protein
MDYTNDACMNQFSHEQVRRLICTMRYYRPLICSEDEPTATLVQRFEATAASEGEVDLKWIAQVDRDVVGWNLYRGRTPEERELVNRETLPADARSEYVYTDTPGRSGLVRYTLAGVGADGAEQWFGSTSLELGSPIRTLSAAILGPNPVRGEVRFGYALPERARVRVEVFSVTGQRLRTLVSGEREAGNHTGTFSIRDGARSLGPGIYLIRVSAGEESSTLRVVALD